VRFGGGQEIWDEIYDQFGLVALLSGDTGTGTQAGGWFANELTGLADIQGLRFRTPGLGGQVWQKMGASVTNVAPGEIFPALQSGTLDAAEFVGPYNDRAFGFHQVRKHYYTSSFVEPGLATEVAIDKAKFLDLPSDLQQIIRDAAQAEYDNMPSEFYYNDPIALDDIVKNHGVIVHKEFPEEIIVAGAKAARELLEEIIGGADALTRKTADSYIKAFNLLRTRTQNTDQTFALAREKYFDISDLG